jgi:4-amino-4-deoxy-L-arabinose transferase-like glycosyltransferase
MKALTFNPSSSDHKNADILILSALRMHSGKEMETKKLAHEGKLMDIESGRNSGRSAGTFGRLLRLALLIIVSVLLALYIFSLPLGLELFLRGNLSSIYPPSYPVQVKLFSIIFEISLSDIFVFFVLLYASCFVLAWKFRNNLKEFAKGFFSKPMSFAMKDFLFALPIISSLTYIVAVGANVFMESYGIPVGNPPLPADPLLAYYGLAVSPITEEMIYRILPIGVFLAVRLLTLPRSKESSESLKERLKIIFMSFVSPEDAKKASGLKTVSESGLHRGISHDEWVMIFFTSVLFALSHYFFTDTWMVGKVASTFIQGLVMGLTFLIYGFFAPILIHWFFDYYFYTYSLAAAVHPFLAGLGFLNDELTWSIGVLAMFVAAYSGLKQLAKAENLKLEMLLSPAARIRNELIAKTKKLLFRIRRLDRFDLATLILTLIIFSARLAIVNSPGPESGANYSKTGLVFDESYYVSEARKLLVGEASTNESHNEHPPLAKAFIMLGMVLFGDNPLGWRISSIIASSISLILVYEIAFLLCGRKSASFFAPLLFATDIMAFNVGQIAILDAPSMLFVLAGSILLLKGKNDLGGLFFGLASLCKLDAIFASAGVVFFLVLLNSGNRKKDSKFLREQITLIARIFLVGFVTLLMGLWVYDAAYRVFSNNPLEHFIFMYDYHSSLTYQNPSEVILPLQWINPFNLFSPAPYYVTTATETLNGSLQTYHPIAYYGLYTPLWWSIWILMPIAFIGIVRKARKNEKRGTELFVLLWIGANYFPYVLMAYLMRRWVYPFYFYMTLPGLYIGLSNYLSCSKLAKILLVSLACIQSAWFFIWFPVKPKILIDLLLFLGLPA